MRAGASLPTTRKTRTQSTSHMYTRHSRLFMGDLYVLRFDRELRLSRDLTNENVATWIAFAIVYGIHRVRDTDHQTNELIDFCETASILSTLSNLVRHRRYLLHQ